MANNLHSTTREVWHHVIGLGKGATFTGPDIQKKFPRLSYQKVYGKLAYLVKLDVLCRTNTWTGENYIVYEVSDDKKIPKSLDLSPFFGKKKKIREKNPAVFLFKKNVNIAEAVNDMADKLTEILQVAKEHPLADIQNFTTTELFKELERRTAPV